MVKKHQLQKLFEDIMLELTESGFDLKYDTLTREVMLPEYPGIRMTIHIGSIFNEYVFPEDEEIH